VNSVALDRGMRAILIGLIVGGCVHASAIACSDGRICPALTVRSDDQKMIALQALLNSWSACARPIERSPSQIDDITAFVPT
jgi:hypothetical protein